MTFIGKSQPRSEDRRLLTGRGRFVADIRLPRMVHAAIARSPVAHGRIRSIAIDEARALPGVLSVLAGPELAAELGGVPGAQNRPPASWRARVEHEIDIPDQPLVAVDRVRYVGEAIALVVAETRYIAEDALDLIEADIEPLAVVTDPAASAERIARFRIRKGDTTDAALAGLRRLRRRFVNHRYLAAPIECRGVVAEYEPGQGTLTVWSATQVVHWVRREVARQLKMPEARVRCLALDVGGGFGGKGHVYPEDVLIPYLARRLERPVAWIEDRREHLLNATHSRDDAHEVEIVFDDAGRIHALIDSFVKDTGAYMPVGLGAPSNTATHMLGQYHVPNVDFTASVVRTNKAPNAPYRGSGRPEGAFVFERLLDLVARELAIEPIEIRRRNLIPADRMPYAVGLPYRDGVMVTYDSGDFPRTFEAAIAAIGGVEAFRAEQKRARAAGRLIGLGVCCYVEGTGAGPFEGATIRIEPSGGVVAITGACSQGQGHETVFAQVVADEWGVRPEDVTMILADTASIAYGYGTIASRSAVNSSAAIHAASATLRERVFALAADTLECSAADLELADGHVRLKGVPEHKIGLGEIARTARLEATEYFEPPTVTWAYGTHAAIVEVDPGTGAVRLLRYVAAHDAGVLINPMVVDGQIIGGIVQGIGGALLERVRFDAEGQNLTASLADYLLPVAADLPAFELIHTETPSPLNALGVKGLGEGGAVGPPAVIANGICDALGDLGFEIDRTDIDCAAIAAALADSPASA